MIVPDQYTAIPPFKHENRINLLSISILLLIAWAVKTYGFLDIPDKYLVPYYVSQVFIFWCIQYIKDWFSWCKNVYTPITLRNCLVQLAKGNPDFKTSPDFDLYYRFTWLNIQLTRFYLGMVPWFIRPWFYNPEKHNNINAPRILRTLKKIASIKKVDADTLRYRVVLPARFCLRNCHLTVAESQNGDFGE